MGQNLEPKDVSLRKTTTHIQYMAKNFEGMHYYHVLREWNSVVDRKANEVVTLQEGELKISQVRLQYQHVP